MGNEACPEWNPQSEFTSDEENSTFQGIFMPMERTVYTYSNLVKILILTKGVDFFDTLAGILKKDSSFFILSGFYSIPGLFHFFVKNPDAKSYLFTLSCGRIGIQRGTPLILKQS